MRYGSGMLSLLLLCAARAAAASGAEWHRDMMNLTFANEDELDALVFGPDVTTSTLVLYTAPVCKTCRAAEEAMAALAAEYAGSNRLTIAYYNSTTLLRQSMEGSLALMKQKVEKFPAIRYFNPPMDRTRWVCKDDIYIPGCAAVDETGGQRFHAYTGSRKLRALRDFASTLRPRCLPQTWEMPEFCSAEQKDEVLADYREMPLHRLEARLQELTEATEKKQQQARELDAARKRAFGHLKSSGEEMPEFIHPRCAATPPAPRPPHCDRTASSSRRARPQPNAGRRRVGGADRSEILRPARANLDARL